MHTRIEHAGVALAMRIGSFTVERADTTIQTDLTGRQCKTIAAFSSSLRLHQSGLAKNPHQLSRIRSRNTFESSNLRESQRFAGSFRARQLQQAPEAILFLR